MSSDYEVCIKWLTSLSKRSAVNCPKEAFKKVDRRVRVERSNGIFDSNKFVPFNYCEEHEEPQLLRFAAASLACRTIQFRTWDYR